MDEEVVLSLADALNLAGVLHILVVELRRELSVLQDSVGNLPKINLVSDDDDGGLDDLPIYIENQLVPADRGVSRDGPGGSRAINLDLCGDIFH